MDLEEEIDRLYSLPLEEFTPARNALAKELGEGEDAKRVKALRKPTLSAWAVNQAVRAEPGLLEALLGAGGELRQAHRQATRGTPSQLRAAADAEREAVEALAGAARKAAGRRAGEPFMGRVRETLHAASLDVGARDIVASGRVVSDLRAVGLGDLGSEPPGPRAKPSPVGRPSAGVPSSGGSARGSTPKASPPPPDPRPLRREVRAAEKAVASAETRVENAREALDEARAALKEQKERLRKAKAALKKAGG